MHKLLRARWWGAIVVASACAPSFAATTGFCSSTADVLKTACDHAVAEDLAVTTAACINISDATRRNACNEEAAQTAAEAAAECRDLLVARKDVCAKVGEARYEPAFGPAFAAQFVDPRAIGTRVPPNPYFPLTPGIVRVYEQDTEDDEGESVVERVTITTTTRIKLVDGIRCLAVRDRVELDGDVVEDTEDWFAQDRTGNVWYCGEIAQSFEDFEGDVPERPELVSIEGSWKAGRDLAKAGLIMPAAPQVGRYLRQEVAWSIAEDVIRIAALNGSAVVPAATCSGNCLVTKDFSALSPGAFELKYYARGVGSILEVDPENDERLELIEVRRQ